jgi:quercetin dioxygenase-like cupin family protein
MPSSERRLPASRYRFTKNADVATQAISRLEGHAENSPGALSVKELIIGCDAALLEFRRAKGLVDPRHAHPDHESICYLVSGRVRVVIDEEEFIAEAGDAWIHPAGVPHFHETLEDSVQIEIKSPPTRTLD